MRSLKDHFGTDGLGDILEDRDSEIWKNQIQKEQAVHAMIRLINENQGEEVRNEWIVWNNVTSVVMPSCG